MQFPHDNNNATNEDNVLLFNPTGASFTGDGDTYKDLRVALMTGDKVLVVGGDSTTTHIDSIVTKYTETANLPKFSNYVVVGTNVDKAIDYTDVSKNNYLLGTILSTDTLDLTIVAWLEEADGNVTSTKTLTTSTSANLSFYSIKPKLVNSLL